MIDQASGKFLFWLLLATAVAQAIFAAKPAIDLWVSALFFDSGQGFWLSRDPALSILRDLLRAPVWLVFLSALALAVRALFRPGPPRLGARPWLFACACLALGPGLLVNVVLKDHWGRARPSEILQFGGAARFTPAFQIADQCARNCSFTSGEAASASMTAMVLLVLLWTRLEYPTRIALSVGLGAIALGTGALRILMGRHFLSDVVFSQLFCALILVGLYRLMGMQGFIGVTPADPRSDLGA